MYKILSYFGFFIFGFKFGSIFFIFLLSSFLYFPLPDLLLFSVLLPSLDLALLFMEIANMLDYICNSPSCPMNPKLYRSKDWFAFPFFLNKECWYYLHSFILSMLFCVLLNED